MRVVPQAGNCREIEVGGRVYRRRRNGLFDMPDAVGRYVVKNEGGQEAALSGTTRSEFGYRCGSCGFGSFFSTCGRCGGSAVRELQVA
jgi:hypothetical protein